MPRSAANLQQRRESGAEAARSRQRRASATPDQRANEAQRSRRRRANQDDSDQESDSAPRRRRRLNVEGDAGDGHQEERRADEPQQHAVPWWDRLHDLANSSRPITLKWRDPCVFCGAELLESESKSFCCGNGKAVLPTLEPYPNEIRALILQDAAAFAGLSRKLNNIFCFTTLGTTGGFLKQNDRRLPPGAPTVVLNGITYHSARPVDKPGHSVFWLMYDQDARNDNASNQGIPPAYITAVDIALRRVNFFSRSLTTFADWNPTQQATLELTAGDAGAEVAALMYTGNRAKLTSRTVIYRRQGDDLPTSVDVLSPLYEALHYALLFPVVSSWDSAKLGWKPANEYGLSQIQWYKRRLLSEPRFSVLDKLGCEYICDMWCRAEEQRLKYIRAGKTAERNRERAFVDDGGDEPDEEFLDDNSDGLPASFLGSARWTSENCADALALARKYGRPHFMITATCNRDWPELASKLRGSKNANLNPVITTRVFRERLKRLMARIKQTRIEVPFEQLDSVISGELPREPGPLRNAMLKYMQHPQTHLNSRRYSRCNKKGRCAYGFPHPVTPRSVIGEDGKVKFRRRYEDSAWTATIVPALLLEWDGHLHADALFTSKVFIYAFKYLYKGPDEANVRLTDSRDKSSPDDFFNARYLSACEAAWRIFAFNIVKKEPSVSSLSVHLPDQQRVQYHRNAGSSSVSDLIRYLELRPRTEPFLSMTYVQYFEAVSFAPFNPSNPLPPQHHLELQSRDPNVRRNIVKLRTRGDHVARLQTIPPGRGEPFYLRAILQHGAATSWDDLYSHEGVRHQSFAEKAVALGLFRDENEAQYAMREAIEHLNTPAQGRFLFANLILEGAEPSELWREFEEWLSSDYLDSTRDAATAHRKTLLSINALFVEHGKSCASFGLPQPDDYSKEVEVELEAFLHQRVALQHRAADMEADFNDGQRAVYHRIIHHIEHSQSTGALIFLEAKAGCGKTFVMQALAAGLRGSGEIVLITGSTALAASLHTRGRTMHNLFKVPVSEDNSNIRCNIERGSTRADLLLAGIVYIMDDIAMSNRAVVEAVDELMRRLTGIDRPMGGKVVVALGDFQQVGPVVKHGGISATVDASIKSSYLWDSFEVLHLLERVRNADDPEYADFVDAVGADTSGARIDLTPFLAHSPSLGEALDHLYPREVLLDAKLCLDRSWLSPHNVFVDEVNKTILDRLNGEQATHFSHNEIKELDEPLLQAPTLEYVESLKENGIPPHVLHLKVGAICVIMRNLSIERGLVKNAKVVVTARHRHLIEVLLLNRDGGDETTHLLPRINFSFSPDWHNFTVLRRQFPLRLAYASTFNSCQGQTIGRLMLDFRSEPFSHGQLYTALSRVRNRNDAMVYIPGDDGLTVRNVVYEDLLL